jgi:hypothetical protein
MNVHFDGTKCKRRGDYMNGNSKSKHATIVIHIPILPDRRLGPNASRRQHWGIRAKAKADLQEAVFGGCLEAKQEWARHNGGCWMPLTEATLDVKIVTRDRRRIMDRDNTIACLKHAIDVLQIEKDGPSPRAGIIVDDKNLAIGEVEWVLNQRVQSGIVFTIKGE